MKFSEISKLAQNGEIQIGAVSLRSIEVLWAGAQFTSLYSLGAEGMWEYTAMPRRNFKSGGKQMKTDAVASTGANA